MKTADVTGDAMRVLEGKSAAAVRMIPLTPAVHPLVARLLSASTAADCRTCMLTPFEYPP